MSSTRKAMEGSPFRQERFASAPEFERGLMANLVAKRCAVLESRADRQLIWFLQMLSHQDGGIKKLAADLTAKYPKRVATQTMQKFGTKPGKMYSASQVKILREEFGIEKSDMRLYGEISDGYLAGCLSSLPDDKAAAHEMARAEANEHPKTYPATEFTNLCKSAANDDLERHLLSLCLDPSKPVADGAPWYFPTLVSTLREFQVEWIAARQPEVVTTIGERIGEALEYAVARRKLVIIDGQTRTGKSHATTTWCKLNPGSVRYVPLSSSNDDISFFREIALALGVSVNLNSKAQELRCRIEETLRAGDLAIVFDEAHYLWPQRHYHNTTPARINWVMTALVNRNIAVALVTTPQFFRSLTAIEKTTHWTSDQFKGRIGRYIKLPDVLSDNKDEEMEQLEEVGRVMLPGVSAASIRAAACYAKASGKYLGALEAIADTAKYFCESDGREKPEFKDVERAIRESVTPSDEALNAAFASATQTKRRRVSNVNAAPLQTDFERVATPLPREEFPPRNVAPARQVTPEKMELSPG